MSLDKNAFQTDVELSDEINTALIQIENGLPASAVFIKNSERTNYSINTCANDVKSVENVKLQYLASFTATIALFMAGLNWGWSGPTFIKMTSPTFPIHVTTIQLSWIASIMSLASIVGPLLGAITVDLIGRKPVILLLTIPYLIEWILLYYSDQTIIVVYIARILAGLAAGVALSIIPMYLGEISSPDIRGKLSNLVSIQIHTGVLFSYVIGPYVSLQISSIISAIFPVLFFVIFVFMPESPYFYIMKNDHLGAKKALRKLRGDLFNADSEISRISSNIVEHEGVLDLFRTPINRKVLYIVISMFTIQHLTGGAFVLAYSPTVLADIKSPIPTAISTALFALVYLLSTIITGFLVDHFGRKCLLLTSSIGTAIPLAVIGFYFLLRDVYLVDVAAYTVIPTVGLICFPLTHGIGLGSVPFVMQGELFSPNIKTIASIIATVIASILAFLVLKMYHPIRDVFGMHAVFFIFCASCLVGSWAIVRFVPETKNKTLEQIQNELREKKV